jgi:hypothetical protein
MNTVSVRLMRFQWLIIVKTCKVNPEVVYVAERPEVITNIMDDETRAVRVMIFHCILIQ